MEKQYIIIISPLGTFKSIPLDLEDSKNENFLSKLINYELEVFKMPTLEGLIFIPKEVLKQSIINLKPVPSQG